MDTSKEEIVNLRKQINRLKILNHRMPTNSLRPQLGQQPKTWANTRI